MITAFLVRCLDSTIPLLVIAEISRPKLVSIAEQAGLSLNWSQTLKAGFVVMWLIYELPHDKNKRMTCASSEDSDQPGHQPSLIRVFAVLSKGSQGPKLSSRGQRKLWSDWADAQVDLSIRLAYVILLVLSCIGPWLCIINCLWQSDTWMGLVSLRAGHGPDEWLSFWRVTSEQFWFWLDYPSFMHQSFVTTAPMGPENSADINISLQSPGICLALREHFYDQSPAKRPAQILACKSEITLVVWAWESKASCPWFHGTLGMMLRSKHGT